jgi:glucose-1-phosphatase
LKTSDIQLVNKKKIKNIIFDWGGVITNISYQATIDAFAQLGFGNFGEYFRHTHQDDIFKQFEVGNISPANVRNSLRNLLPGNTLDSHIDEAWCAMLFDTPSERLELLKDLAEDFDLFLLSNTNKIHAEFYMEHLKINNQIDFSALFKKVYLSHEIRMRKPTKEIFEFVLKDSLLNPVETLFIDDTEINIDVADTLNIQSFYLKPNQSIVEIFQIWR